MDTRKILIKNNKYLFWDIAESEIKNLSDRSFFERILNYSKDMQSVLDFIDILGIKNSKKLFDDIASSKRPLISKKTKNYFSQFFDKYV